MPANPHRPRCPSGTCCWARSRSSPPRSSRCPRASGVDRRSVSRLRCHATEIDLFLRVLKDREAGTAEHRLDRRPVRNPPVRLVLRVAVLDEMHSREKRLLENFGVGDWVILLQRLYFTASTQHRLEDEEIARDVLADEVERQERMAEVVEDAHEQHDVEARADLRDVVD